MDGRAAPGYDRRVRQSGDTHAGRILDHLDHLGLAESTVVVFSSDYGDMMGEHRLLAKAVQYEGASRVPLLVRAPGMDGRPIKTPVSQVDLVPTLLELLGQDVPEHAQGRSLVPLMRSGDGTAGTPDGSAEADGAAGAAGTAVVCEWGGVPRGGSVSGYRPPIDDGSEQSEAIFRAMAAQLRTVRLGQWKLTVGEAGEHELYDLVADPHETRNLLYQLNDAGGGGLTPAAQDAVYRLWEHLVAWQRRTADTVRLRCPLDTATSA